MTSRITGHLVLASHIEQVQLHFDGRTISGEDAVMCWLSVGGITRGLHGSFSLN
jgi:hypothetical protein